MQNDAKLLPCPFCGKTPPHVHLSHVTGRIFCEGCGAEGPWSPYFNDGGWNTRTPHPAPITAREAELEAEIERLTKARDNQSRLEQSHREQANEQFHRAEKAEAENQRLREALKKIASTGRCEFAEVRAALTQP